MAPAVLGALLVSAGVGLHLQEVTDLPLRDAVAVADALSVAVEDRAAVPVRVDDPLAPRCTGSGRCVGDVVARTDADHLVFVRLIGGVTKVRIVAARTDRSGRRVARVVADLPRARAGWTDPLERLAKTLFPGALGPAPGPTTPTTVTAPRAPSPEPSDGVRAAPWVLVGVGVATGIAGTAFGLSAESARADIESGDLRGTAYTDALDRVDTHGMAANVLLGVAVGATVTGVAWLIFR